MTRLLPALAAALGAVSLSLACSSQSRLRNGVPDSGSAGSGSGTGGEAGDDSSGGSNSSGGSGGGSSGGMAGDGPGTCDETAAPSEAECLLTEEYGVFVAPTGSDTADGSRTAPVRTIGKAQELAADSARQRIYVCHGTYAEAVTISAATAEASLYGGFDCETWAHDGVKSIVSPVEGSALRIVDALARRVEVQDLELASPDAEDPGASSVAAFVSDSLEVAFDRVRLSAGKGANAAPPGVPATNHLPPNLLDQITMGPTTSKVCQCPVYGSSTGGYGGNEILGAIGGKGGADPVASVDPLYGSANGVGGVAGNCGSGSPGARGAWRPGGVAATTFGSISADGWIPSVSGNGEAGNPGQGGGGGGLEDHGGPVWIGGGGGCGSCGGSGGLGGTAGGASIGLLVLSTPVIMNASVVVTSDGGSGAVGGDGENARTGGKGGLPGGGGGTNVCKGGPGGSGAPGSGGAGGNGGISAGIVYAESPPPSIDGMPEVEADTLPGFTLGEPGNGGNGGVGGDIAATNNVPSNFGKAGEGGALGLQSAILALSP